MKSLLLLILGVCAGFGGTSLMQEHTNEPTAVQVFQVAELQKQRAGGRGAWLEFLRSDDLYCGLYELKADSHDGQQPHREDEVYYVLSGKAVFESDGKQTPVKQGSVIFVAKRADHRFIDIEEDISLLVFFATPSKDTGKEDGPAKP